MEKQKIKRNDLIEPTLSYQIVGILFDVYNELGHGHPEKIYQRATREALQKASLHFKEQLLVPVSYHGISVGKYFLDFLIEDKIILELKQGDRFSGKNFDQVTAYLMSKNIPLAILANFGTQGVVFRRVLKPITNS